MIFHICTAITDKKNAIIWKCI